MEVARWKSAKDMVGHKILLVEEIKNNIQQPNFKGLILALYCYCGVNIKYRLLSRNLFQTKQQYGGSENFSITINFHEK